MCTYEDLVDATLPHGFIPLVVPQLRTITLGGAVTGLGIESTSFRNGLPHESVLEMDVLTGAGEVVTTDARARTCSTRSPTPTARSATPTRLRIRLEQAPAYVDLRHLRFDDLDVARQDDRRRSSSSGEHDGVRVDGLDGVVVRARRGLPDAGHLGGPTDRQRDQRLHRAWTSTSARSSSARPTR